MNPPALRDRNFGIVIPAFEAAKTLANLLEDVTALITPEKVMIVDDGSADGTAGVAEAKRVLCLRHPENRGKGAALMTGLSRARELGWEWAVTMDADGQHAAADLPRFFDARPGPETGILVGRRERRGTSMPWHRRFSNFITTGMVSRLAGKPVHDAQSGFRAYRLDILDAFPRSGRFEWESQALILSCRRGIALEPISIRTLYYPAHGSHMRLLRDSWRFLRMAWGLAWIS